MNASAPEITPEALADLLPSRGHIGVPCSMCRASVGVPCRKPDLTPAPCPHGARERRAWHVRHWLFLHGVDANEAAR